MLLVRIYIRTYSCGREPGDLTLSAATDSLEQRMSDLQRMAETSDLIALELKKQKAMTDEETQVLAEAQRFAGVAVVAQTNAAKEIQRLLHLRRQREKRGRN